MSTANSSTKRPLVYVDMLDELPEHLRDSAARDALRLFRQSGGGLTYGEALQVVINDAASRIEEAA